MVTFKTHAADDSDCAPDVNNPGPVIVQVTQRISPLEEDPTKTREEITQLVGRPASGVFHEEGVDFNIQYEVALSSLQTPPMVCMLVKRVEGVITVKKMAIYTAKEYPPGSCRYVEIMAHERVHDQIFTTLIDLYAERLRESIRRLDLPSADHPWSVSSLDEGTQRVRTLLIDVTQSVSNHFNQEYDRRTNEFHEQALHKHSQCQ